MVEIQQNGDCAIVGCSDPGQPIYKQVWVNLEGGYFAVDPVPRLDLCVTHWPCDCAICKRMGVACDG